MKQRQDFRGAQTKIFMGLACWLANRTPLRAGIRTGSEWTGFILAPDGNPQRFPQAIRLFNQRFFASVSRSRTITRPRLCNRSEVPVTHQVRVRCYEAPASRKTRRIVLALTRAPLRYPAWQAAVLKVAPSATASRACARCR